MTYTHENLQANFYIRDIQFLRSKTDLQEKFTLIKFRDAVSNLSRGELGVVSIS